MPCAVSGMACCPGPARAVEVVPEAPHSIYWETPGLFDDAVGSFPKDVAAA